MTLVEDIKEGDSDFHALAPLERLATLGVRDLVAEARGRQLRRAYHYDGHVTRVLEDLVQRRSVLLLGQAGVGKTAVLHEIAARLAAWEVPDPLRGAALIQISTSAIMEGARHFGDWEIKLRAVLDALGELAPAFLYIDNIWNLPQAGVSRESAESFATYLKPHLEARRVTLLGECTPANFRRAGRAGPGEGALADAPELLRLFDLITIDEPSRDIAASIACDRATELEQVCAASIDRAAVSRCIELAERFLRHKARPGAALDLLDDVVRPHILPPSITMPTVASTPPASREAQRPATLPRDACAAYLGRAYAYVMLAAKLEAKAADVPKLGTQTARMSYSQAYTALQEGHVALRQAFRELPETALVAAPAAQRAGTGTRPSMAAQGEAPGTACGAKVPERPRINADAVMGVFARKTGLPEALFSDRIPLTRTQVRERLGADVFGQDDAVEAVVERIIAIKADLTDPARPLGVLLFAGPTGSGKTHLASALAAYLAGGNEGLVRLDMSDYRDPSAAAALPDHLADRMGQRLFAVVLLDEIEKAPPEVLDIFLQGFGDGYLRSASGRTVWLRNTVIIITSNLGSDLGALARHVGGFAPGRQRIGEARGARLHCPDAVEAERHHARLVASIDAAVRDHFRPEWINRIDRIVAFRALDPTALRLIAHREVDRALGRGGITRRGYTVTVDGGVLDLLVAAGTHPLYGARPLQRAVANLVVAPLAEAIAAEPERAGGTLAIGVEGGRVVLRQLDAAPASSGRAVLALRA